MPKPIKLQEQHRAFFPLNEPISERAGELMGRWAKGDADSPPSEADQLLVDNPLALLIGMLMDQQVPMGWAFRGPFTASKSAPKVLEIATTYDPATPFRGAKRLATQLGVSPPSVTHMLARLAVEGLVSHRPRAGARLTAKGRRAALEMVRRHRILETFLVRVLKLDWAEVHEDAEVLEHHISDRVLHTQNAYFLFHCRYATGMQSARGTGT